MVERVRHRFLYCIAIMTGRLRISGPPVGSYVRLPLPLPSSPLPLCCCVPFCCSRSPLSISQFYYLSYCRIVRLCAPTRDDTFGTRMTRPVPRLFSPRGCRVRRVTVLSATGKLNHICTSREYRPVCFPSPPPLPSPLNGRVEGFV